MAIDSDITYRKLLFEEYKKLFSVYVLKAKRSVFGF